jgi:hypothetical protein
MYQIMFPRRARRASTTFLLLFSYHTICLFIFTSFSWCFLDNTLTLQHTARRQLLSGTAARLEAIMKKFNAKLASFAQKEGIPEVGGWSPLCALLASL